ncbi:MAG: DUF1761 domain-containing protein [Pseudohongiellaceae bacterium]
MDTATAVSAINSMAVIIAAVSAFCVGGLWYGPLFGRAWMDAWNFTEEQLATRNMPMVFGVSLILSFIAALNLAMFIGAEADLAFGVVCRICRGPWLGGSIL